MEEKYRIVGIFIGLMIFLGILLVIIPQQATVSGQMIGKRPMPVMDEYKITAGPYFTASTSVVDAYAPGTKVTKTLDVSGTIIDEDYTDGDVTYVYARAVTFFNGNDIITEEWIKLNTHEYEETFSYTWNNAGKYAYVLFMCSAHSEYDYNLGSWSDYIIQPIDKEKYLFNIFPEAPQDPLQFLADFFDQIINWIKEFF